MPSGISSKEENNPKKTKEKKTKNNNIENTILSAERKTGEVRGGRRATLLLSLRGKERRNGKPYSKERTAGEIR